MTRFHDRAPVVIERENFDARLSGDNATALLRPAREDSLLEWVVSSRVNRSGVGDDEPGLIEPLRWRSELVGTAQVRTLGARTAANRDPGRRGVATPSYGDRPDDSGPAGFRQAIAYSAASIRLAMRRLCSDNSRYCSCHLLGPLVDDTCTAVTLYSGQLVAQSEFSVVTTLACVIG